MTDVTRYDSDADDIVPVTQAWADEAQQSLHKLFKVRRIVSTLMTVTHEFSLEQLDALEQQISEIRQVSRATAGAPATSLGDDE